jgi:hypothetical protein
VTDQLPSLPARIWIAIACFLRALSDARFASLVAQLQSSNALPAAPGAVAPLAAAPSLPPPPAVIAPVVAAPIAPPPPAPPDVATAQEGALHLLAILQREARLLDFCEEELTGFSDAAIGAAARLVHSGCRKALREHLDLAPVRSEAEGASVTLAAGFDARANRLTGNIVGAPPFTGTLKHHGWKAVKVKLPEPVRGEASRLLAPAEVELS